ncbi:MAG: prolyl oligopeptidase family serine peptidase [Acidimicrobiia bacterium]|nr:prolyl oligopeptidase family serine peptidase [Acidimicrobiia bacterium]
MAHLTRPAVVERYGAHPDQLIELRLPEGIGPHPTVVLIHGGFWRHQYLRDTLDRLAIDFPARGIGSANIEYRRVGSGGGGMATLEDVRSALQLVAGLPGVDATRIVVVGHSAGGHLALWAASPSGAGVPLRLAVSLAGVTDLARGRIDRLGDGAVDAFLGGVDPDPISPIAQLPLGTPSLCVHGSDDANVPVEYSVRFVEAATAAGDSAELIVGDGDDHFAPIDPTHALWGATQLRIEEALE